MLNKPGSAGTQGALRNYDHALQHRLTDAFIEILHQEATTKLDNGGVLFSPHGAEALAALSTVAALTLARVSWARSTSSLPPLA